MSLIASRAFRPMLRPIRKVHLPGTPGIYNTKLNWKPGPNWMPQGPHSMRPDMWACTIAPAFLVPNMPLWVLKVIFLSALNFWSCFFVLEYQLKKQSNA